MIIVCYSAVAYSYYGEDENRHTDLRIAAADAWVRLDGQVPEGTEKERLRNLISGGLPDGRDMDYYNNSITLYAQQVTMQPGVFAGPGEAIAMARSLNRCVIFLVKEGDNSVRIHGGYMPDLSIVEINEPKVYHDSQFADIFTRFQHNNENPLIVWYDGINHFHGIHKI